MDYLIRPVEPKDGAAIISIFKEGIAGGNATFDRDAPSWEAWDLKYLQNCRFVAVDEHGKVVGWAAIQAVSPRDCFRGVAEVSIYLAHSVHGQGLGARLLGKLVEDSEKQGFWMLQAGIFRENIASISLHKKFGFREVGFREKIGKMNGVWRDILLLERRSKVVN
ncbi:N-acetyltransferase [Chryseobacterium sp. 6424]|uniref:GNAT family N-acetyltransferase n=1 Tax=Chryseobacterium sp. 6424 TaxID=2039166 RepID=UPI000EFC24CE|nr:GNAT family N-acetyltransferase [Chryseobacterium sp. 6424]AYO58102.1 N-acetyltransferase [Chryseobacterium sp. 6424]